MRFFRDIHPLSRLIEFDTGIAMGAIVTQNREIAARLIGRSSEEPHGLPAGARRQRLFSSEGEAHGQRNPPADQRSGCSVSPFGTTTMDWSIQGAKPWHG
jgi:hypothetical protein